ncbi:glycosyltransferase family 1 protein [Afifella sp. IM 167]|uniref:glycosyltransferase family 4 protein n=1 Tax=Afifella sp. IM 167 TaxID=2033586 RepID=UPI001CCBB3E5|nr:glycosyltransferase family 1 protein [Afifella sp. IM 167]MBZ8135299.1 alpha-mannosyltransferase [Afifella sp. IM 167]
MKLVIVTDAWFPQVNGVVRSLQHVVETLSAQGDEVTVIAPEAFSTLPLPTYPDIRLSITTARRVGRMIEAAAPDFVHIATEGPLGLLARRHCLATHRTFTTSYHTKFPEYLRARAPVPVSLSYRFMRWFHNAGSGCMVATPTLEAELESRGFRNLMRWSRGVDAETFRPRPEADLGLKRPVFMNVGRVAVEKNLAAFTSLDLPGTKVVVGGGPALADLKARFPDVVFLGEMHGEELAEAYAAADVFVFPSLTDTFGNVLLEALASGLPVAAFPVTGPKDVITDPRVGALSEDLREACLKCLDLSSEAAREFALAFTWEASVQEFRDNVVRGQGSALDEAA